MQLIDAIQTQLKDEVVLLCDVEIGDKDFCKPIEAGTIILDFKCVLEKSRGQG